MRIVTWDRAGVSVPAALVDSGGGDRLVDLSGVVASTLELLTDEGALADARAVVDAADPSSLPARDGERLLAPVSPRVLLCIGYNYRGHVVAGGEGQPDPEHPDVFVKTANTTLGPDDAVVLPPQSDDVDYEGEIGVVIGRTAAAVSAEDALDHVAGYTLVNDVSARDWQNRTSQWTLGKCFDGFAPIGPAIVTADEIADPADLLVEVIRDGKTTVSQSTSTLIFPFAEIVSYVSQSITLQPGDVIATGSPQKLPDALREHRALADGDSVRIRVAGIGELVTVFRSA
ncbi:fumarylacetoacetate hydrolase family protein [Pseudoclavibacter sp. RFBA6]|uniref:fumarylacetoacetate hydrolase family protein n=1 Tax=Pseudoclavibacter sp. RFBA6 TaxID=2080573 RepID=UPI000CE74577|nr:fumarylacetoacetate hydrolase family protein [Pseudoclavibacter sp. RFBA6]PPG42678.1 2-keto-4-pentenoate hydratase [Pseudoclavibacter sp. RFBA6]